MRNAPKLPREKAELVQRFFRRSYIRVYNVSRKISEAAQVHVWDNEIRPKDAIHVATAIHLGSDALETFDANLIGKSGAVGKPLLLIREPQAAAQRSLDLAYPTEIPT